MIELIKRINIYVVFSIYNRMNLHNHYHVIDVSRETSIT